MAQKKSPKSSKQALQPQPDPRAPVDSKLLLQHLTLLMTTLEQDLLERADGSTGLTEALQARHAHDVAAERTADAYDPWRRGVVTQVAAAWVLNVVFVRVLEDRGLVDQNRIAGPGAEGSQGEFLKLAPFLTDRDYLLTVFRELSHFEVTRELFDPKRNLAFRITPSAEGAKALLQVFRQGSAEAPSFRFGQADTRFLGDLYQDLSESVRKKYALLQTPDFIEAFILDRTLDPAFESYGLDATTIINPTCGSGHFLLGAFERLFECHLKERPNQNPREAAQKALGAVFGTDINPYAVSIAKFRLMLAFLDRAGLTKLSSAPEVRLNVVVADSLFHQVAGEHPGQTDFGYRPGQKTRDWFDEAFALEEDEKAKAILGRGFAAVVGNPPYITVKDGALRDAYRARYKSAFREYSLGVPFTERFFSLARAEGYVGLITANSFMKREFGKKLIADYLPTVDLQCVVNTSGAYIPGHGTPTVLLFGQKRAPMSARVRTVLAKRGEPVTPADPARGLVWSSVEEHVDHVGFENDFISVVDTTRASLAKHPWSLGGGGANELKTLLESRAEGTLGALVKSVGFMCITKQDEVFSQPQGVFERHDCDRSWLADFIIGENVRDWAIQTCLTGFFPYNLEGNARVLQPQSPMHRFVWPYRAVLEARAVFGGQTFGSAGRGWYEYGQIPRDRIRGPAITFAFVATHNHFVLDRGGKVFNRSAPIIKLPESATEDDHYALLAYLNSSTACFWMKQVMMNKGGSGIGRGIQDEAWESRFEFDGTKLATVVLPTNWQSLSKLGRLIHETRQELNALSPRAAIEDGLATDVQRKFAEGVALQEDLDWHVYELFGLVDAVPTPLQRIDVGSRAFEVILSGKQTAWFARNRYQEPTASASELVANHLRLISDSKWISLIETPEYKRRWTVCDLEALSLETEQRGQLDSLEQVVQAATAIGKVSDEGGLAMLQSVPYLSVLRYTPSGLEKYAEWLRTWELQRGEDAGQAVGPIAVPRKYKPEDFKQGTYWSLRGKLDVPKERFISYPGCSSDEDQSPVYGWAGWNHLERARALAALYDTRKEEGWKTERLLPMLVGLLELLPWLKQYHNAPDEAVGGERPAEEFDAFIAGELRNAGKTAQEAERAVLAWAQAGGAKSGSRNAAQRVATELEDGEPESGTRSSSPPDAVDDASRVQSSKAARLRKARPRDTGTPENDTAEALESSSPSRPRVAAAGAASPKRRPATSTASKRRKG